jgi:hypothetical protein
MTKLNLDISMSLDGFIAGLNQTLAEPLGMGGEVSVDSEVVEESLRNTGATVMAGDGVRLFESRAGAEQPELECTRVIESPRVTHLRCRVVK